jgi:hypothetical protein
MGFFLVEVQVLFPALRESREFSRAFLFFGAFKTVSAAREAQVAFPRKFCYNVGVGKRF